MKLLLFQELDLLSGVFISDINNYTCRVMLSQQEHGKLRQYLQKGFLNDERYTSRQEDNTNNELLNLF